MRSLPCFIVVVGLFLGIPLDADIADNKERNAKFEKELSGVKFIGQFTIDGQEGLPAKEEYTILSVKKLEVGDLWLFKARVKYGKTDITLPMPLPVKWVGDKPVIAMDNVKIIGLGTFSSHVVIDGNRYAGTWQHGKVGGHLFGRIEKIK